MLLGVFLLSCNSEQQVNKTKSQSETQEEKNQNDKIKVLNFATFHMGSSSDAKTIDFDDKSKKNEEDAEKIAEMIAEFKPTVICVERPPSYNSTLNKKYSNFLSHPDSLNFGGEIGLIAFKVGQKSQVQQFYGIDHKMDYNYNISESLDNAIDPNTFNEFRQNPFKSIPDLNPFEKGLSMKEKLKRINHPKFLNVMITANADILTYVGTENGFEGADEAAKYYQRNLRMYSNLNRISLDEDDRVFILSGGSHTAFLNKFLKRSPKYEVVNTFDYLK